LEIITSILHLFLHPFKRKKIGYQGLIYREAVGNISEFTNVLAKRKEPNTYVFAGFNALNVAEEK